VTWKYFSIILQAANLLPFTHKNKYCWKVFLYCYWL